MLTFEEAMTLTSTISSPTAFDDSECLFYFEMLRRIPKHGLAVEVGLQYGRSSSIALQVAQDVGFDYVGIDTFDEAPDVREAWAKMAEPYTKCVYVAPSTSVTGIGDIDLILIDGDHSFEGVMADCKHFEPMMKDWGLMMFHDFARESLPDVERAVRAFFSDKPEWFPYGIGGTLAAWRKQG